MIWQDIVIFIGNIGFAIALVPSIFSASKPSLSTSCMTSIILTMFGATFATLGMIFSSIMSFVNGFLWMVLYFQQLRKERRNV